MAASPKYKVFDADGTYQAACKEPEAAVALTGFYGDGSTVRLEHRHVVWTEGPRGDGAGAFSYDTAAAVILEREWARQDAVRAPAAAEAQSPSCRMGLDFGHAPDCALHAALVAAGRRG